MIQVQREEHEGNETTVLEREELDRVTVMLGHNETWLHLHEVAPTLGVRTSDLPICCTLTMCPKYQLARKPTATSSCG